MRTFTIWQPWASLVMIGAKPYEFRPRSYLQYGNPPKPGERIVIHAGARAIRVPEVMDLMSRIRTDPNNTGLDTEKALALLERVAATYRGRGLLPLGAGLGTAIIGTPALACDVFNIKVEDSDRGQFNWAWPLTDIEPFDAPIPRRGEQGFWHWDRS